MGGVGGRGLLEIRDVELLNVGVKCAHLDSQISQQSDCHHRRPSGHDVRGSAPIAVQVGAPTAFVSAPPPETICKILPIADSKTRMLG